LSISIGEKHDSNRNFGLDLVRTIAILLVVKAHGAFLLNLTFLRDFPTIQFVDGVDLFFVLSGFLIGSILLKEINSETPFGARQLLHFWKRRWFRTLPAYYLILLANYVFVSNGFILDDIAQFNWKFFVFLQNFSAPFYGFFWESWSLAIEEWFYIITPLCLLFILRLLDAKKAFLLTVALMIVLPFCYRIYLMDSSVVGYDYYAAIYRKIVLGRLDSIAFGLLGAWIFLYYQIFWNKWRWVWLAAGVVLMVFLIWNPSPYNTFYRQVLYFSLSPIAALLLLPFAYNINIKPNFLTRSITHISKISYSMYLINLALIAEVIRDNFAPKDAIDGLLKYSLYWLLVIVGATLLYVFFERPILQLRDRKKQKPDAATALP